MALEDIGFSNPLPGGAAAFAGQLLVAAAGGWDFPTRAGWLRCARVPRSPDGRPKHGPFCCPVVVFVGDTPFVGGLKRKLGGGGSPKKDTLISGRNVFREMGLCQMRNPAFVMNKLERNPFGPHDFWLLFTPC